MARAAAEILGSRLAAGVVVSHQRPVPIHPRFLVLRAGHPVPDRRSLAAGRLAWQIARRGRMSDRLLVLLSGGASSLLVLPARGVTLDDKIRTNRLLLRAGAQVAEVNTVRKHLSSIKGGGLVRASRAPVTALSISDVIGNDPSTIGSGPAAADPTTFADAWRVIVRRGLLAQLPARARRRLDLGRRGKVAETLSPGERRSLNVVIGDNRLALAAAKDAAQAVGLDSEILSTSLRGDVRAAAAWLATRIRRRLRRGRPVCLLAGGETTVRVRGNGKGGRNQELALALAAEIDGLVGVHCLCAGSDGRDGPTDAAGAFVDGATWGRARESGIDAGDFLARNDSHGFFTRAGGLYRPGATGTNVMDIDLVLVSPASVERGRV